MEGLEGLELSQDALTQIQKVVDGQVSGLKTKNDELLGKIKAANTSNTALQERADRFNVMGDLDPNQVRSMFDSIEEGKIAEAMKAAGVNAEQLAPILGPQLEKALKEANDKSSLQINAITTDRDDLLSKNAVLEESVKGMRLDEVSKSSFNSLPDAEKGADQLVADQVRKVFSLDADGKAVALDEDREIRLDSNKQPLSIQTYINEELRQAMPFLFVAPQGGGGKGGRGGTGNGFGTGITDRSNNSPEVMSSFVNAAVNAGKTSEEAAAAWQALPSGRD